MLKVCKQTFFAQGYKVRGGSVLDAEHDLVRRFPAYFVPIEETRIAEATQPPPRTTRSRRTADVEPDGRREGGELLRPSDNGSAKAWREFAEAQGVDVPHGTKRDDIIKLVDNEGQVAY